MVSGRLKRNAVAKLGFAVKKKDAGGLCHLFDCNFYLLGCGFVVFVSLVFYYHLVFAF